MLALQYSEFSYLFCGPLHGARYYTQRVQKVAELRSFTSKHTISSNNNSYYATPINVISTLSLVIHCNLYPVVIIIIIISS